jgi:hypothetical protein
MSKNMASTLNDLMPAVLIKNDPTYMAIVGDEDKDEGALTNEMRLALEFVGYYTRTQRVDDAETRLLDFITWTFTRLRRGYKEPDEYLRLRYKSLVERRHTTNWNGKKSIRSVFSYFYPEKDIYVIERYPIINLVRNGEFNGLEHWEADNKDTNLSLIYARTFEGESSLFIKPVVNNPHDSVRQTINNVVPGIYELVFFCSSSRIGVGDVQYALSDGGNRYWNGKSWGNKEYWFYDIMGENVVSGQYKSVQIPVKVDDYKNITISFKNKNANGILIDDIRFGRSEHPAFRVYIVTNPDLRFNGEIYHNKTHYHNGFKRLYYIEKDMDDILKMVKPAGVWAEMSLLVGRLNVPWDKIVIKWDETVKVKAKVKNRFTIRYKNRNETPLVGHLYHNGKITRNNIFKHNGKFKGVMIGMFTIIEKKMEETDNAD